MGIDSTRTILNKRQGLIARDYFEESGIPTATEGVKSNALMRCCKDLGIASELWDPGFIQKFKSEHCVAEWVTHVTKGQKKLVWRRKDRSFEYPWVKK
ncbi:Mitochondrial genome maintenance protein [Zancudomyces culisetae]|uniref:Mitochondrial genome maintenance protein MGM101 n=1 Tax=Zancudomyces culisetae TaxID=1213189 RepID=A0A1R1PLB7_ZANCU|nr:Mitochondrial genome maintenance protein [Zancudomyces culisetae]|eukprot:OMH81768.1 Mitochondrial genome maintenance protein [Zancudomyces culisetae]